MEDHHKLRHALESHLVEVKGFNNDQDRTAFNHFYWSSSYVSITIIRLQSDDVLQDCL
jgi:hypothetical protein